MPIRIAYVLPQLQPSGNLSQINFLQEQLPPGQFETRLFGFSSVHGSGGDDGPIQAVDRSFAADPCALLRLGKKIKDWQPEVMHVWGLERAGWELYWPLGKWARCGIATVHNPLARGGRVFSRGALGWIRKCRHVTVSSENLLAALPEDTSAQWIRPLVAELQADPATTSRLGTRGFQESSRFLLMAGSSDRAEELELALQVMELLVTVHEDLQLVVLGPMASASWIPRRLEQYQLSDQVHLLEASSEWQQLISLASVVLVPARNTGFSTTALHGMAAAVPVAVADRHPYRQLGEAGVVELFPAGDSGQCARQIHQLLTDPQHARELAVAGQQWFRRETNAAASVAQYQQLYEQISRGRSRAVGPR